ncbi:hypothetical protein QE152_g41444, partial [Popillia japonica]
MWPAPYPRRSGPRDGELTTTPQHRDVDPLPAARGYLPRATCRSYFGATDHTKSLGRGESMGPDSPGPPGTLDDRTAPPGSTAQTISASKGAVPKTTRTTVSKPGQAGIRPPAQPKSKHGTKKIPGPQQEATTNPAVPKTFACETCGVTYAAKANLARHAKDCGL